MSTHLRTVFLVMGLYVLTGCITIDASDLFTIKNPATFEIHGLARERRDEITKAIGELIQHESGQYATSVQDFGEPFIIKAGPVVDPQTLASKITFGKATVEGRTIVVTMPETVH